MPCALWMVQTYLYVPALVNFLEKVTLPAVLDLKPLPTTLCGTPPEFHDQRTVVPFLTVTDLGENASPLTPTFLVAPKATDERTRPTLRAATASRAMSFLTEAPFMRGNRG